MHNQAEKSTFNMWFGDLPNNWSYQKINLLFSERKTKVSDKDYLPLSVAKIGVVPQLDTAVKTDAGDNRKLVRSGDFVINSRSDRKGSCGISNFDGSVSLINIVLTPRGELNRNFIHYLMRSNPFSEEFYRYGRGIVGDLWTTRYSEMKNIFLPIPPRDEQDQIVRFLDWKVSSINRLINIKKKEIKEIESLKKSLIDDCVTHGLNPDAPMKDSGVKWLGQIPAHWGIAPLCAVAKEKSICNCINLQLLSVYLDVGVVPFTEKKEKRTNATSKDLTKYQRVDPCDFVLNNQQAWRGSVGISFHTGIVSPAYIVLSMDNTLNSYFANFLFRSRALVDQYLVVSKGVGSIQRNIYWTTLKRVKFVIPPLEEQNDIVKYLENRLNKYDNFIERIKEEIALLNELKLRLISDVVTGKIDVRDVKIPSFDMVEEDLDEEKFENNDETDESGEVE